MNLNAYNRPTTASELYAVASPEFWAGEGQIVYFGAGVVRYYGYSQLDIYIGPIKGGPKK